MSTVVISEEVKQLLDLVATRYSYDFGAKLLRSKMFSATAQERAEIKRIIEKNKDKPVSEVEKLTAPLKEAIRKKQAPYLDKIRPINQKLKGLDGTIKNGEITPGAIPKALMGLGYTITPKTEVEQ